MIYHPLIVDRICKRLCDCNVLERIGGRGGYPDYNKYLFVIRDRKKFSAEKQRLKYYFNCMVYGFEYIYDLYRDIVIPLVWEKNDGDYAVGTGFKYLNGIVTAKHCIKDVKNLQIRGYRAKDLEGRPVYISDNEGVDLAFIETGRTEEPMLYSAEGEIMQEVLVMGYPRVPTFTNFLTAEKATISSKASSRITPTTGAIAAYGYEYLTKINAMLITARIRGGNSGGPVINERGSLVGISCHIPDADSKNGDYDELGYGVAIPVSYLTDIIDRKPLTMNISNGFFRDTWE